MSLLNSKEEPQEDRIAPSAFGSATSAPPSLFNESAFDLDTFATSSLQAAASAVLAAQQQQVDPDLDALHLQTPSFLAAGGATASQTHFQDPFHESGQSAPLSRVPSNGKSKTGDAAGCKERSASHPERHMWSQEETKSLVDGCNKHGIGNWKAILNDEELAPHFNGRTPGDLKDRFRTYFPDAYHELYPNAKTHTSRAVRSKAPDGKSIFEKGKTKERRPFSPAEDEVLRKGYEQHGSHWAIIAREAIFEGLRKSTDLRDRFRNAFPDLYEQAGYKPRIKSVKKDRRQSSGGGSFSHSERPIISQADWQHDSANRPGFQSRSETSTSVHSQTVSEHSEMSDEGESSDAKEQHHSKERSAERHNRLGSIEANLMPPSLKSQVDSAPSADQRRAEPLPDVSPPSNGQSAQSKPQASLRRSHSTKRASHKAGTADQAVRDAFSKSSKEALLASHQQHHMHHLLQQQQNQGNTTAAAAASSRRPQVGQSFSAGWVPRLSWSAAGSGSPASNIASMDLDQMDELMNNHSASELLNGSHDDGRAAADASLVDEQDHRDNAMSIDVNTQQAEFAAMYQQLALATNGSSSSSNLSSRPLAVESFQDLLDPMLPLSSANMAGWDQLAGNVPWTPVSSAAAASTASTSAAAPTHGYSNATRRDHEHNQWAGDLLHRGNSIFAPDQQGPQSFVSMASMHLLPNSTSLGMTASRNVDQTAVQQPNPFPFARPQQGQASTSTLEQGLQRPSMEQSTAEVTPSVHELISRSTRRQSFPQRPVGLGEDNDEAMQAAYANPYPYPADDISLLNSSAGGSLTLFPSLMGGANSANEYSQSGGMAMRRRRSTDTLREGAYSFPQSWRGGFGDTAQQQIAEEHATQEANADSSHRGTSEYSRSLSDVRTNEGQGDEHDEDRDAPSRAASVGNIDAVGRADNVLYAESLPDLSTGIGGEHTSATGTDSVFSHHNNLQISYDDMDLPSFLNRSPNLLHATPATPAGAHTFGNRQTNESGSALRGASVKVWPFGASSNESGRREEMAPRNEVPARVVSKSIDLSNLFDLGSPFASNPIKDAGALDRLEHLYLEGLHTPSSPLMSQAFHGAGEIAGYNPNHNTTTFASTAQRNLPSDAWWSAIAGNERGATTGGNVDPSGYESA